MTLAQVQFWVAIVVALIASWSALLISVALLLPAAATRAQEELETAARRCGVRGILFWLLQIAAWGVLLNNRIQAPVVKLICLAAALALGAAMTVGAAGLAQLLGARIVERARGATPWGALVRGSVVYSLACLVPVIGWLLFAPIAGIVSMGAGIAAMRSRRPEPLPLAAAAEPRI